MAVVLCCIVRRVLVPLLLLLASCTRAGFGPEPGRNAARDGARDRAAGERGADAAPGDRALVDRGPADAAREPVVDARGAEKPKPDVKGAPDLKGGLENCENGIDDDGDGNIDCMDADCSAEFECVEAPPTGTLSHLRVALATASANPPPPPACGGGKSAERFHNELNPASCSPCGCGAMQGTCSNPTITVWDQAGCSAGNAYDKTALFATAGCKQGPSTLLSAAVTTAPAANASCAPSGGVVNTQPFLNNLDICPTTATGACPAGKICVRRAAAPFLPGPCYRASGSSCPAGFSKELKAYGNYTDGRTCSACACSLPKAPCVGGTYTFHGCTASCSTGCQQVTLKADPPTICLELAPFAGVYSVSYSPPALTTTPCTAKGGTPGGAVVPASGPETICCK